MTFWKRITAVLAVLAVGVLGAAPAAVADDKSKAALAACEYISNTGTGYPYGGNLAADYAYGPQFTTHSWSGCVDIQSPRRERFGPYPTTFNTWFRVRFFPSSGGSYANSWKSNDIDPSANLIIATNVANGTKFRIETQRRLAGGTVVIEPHNFDLMF